jgi:hypothetical protein
MDKVLTVLAADATDGVYFDVWVCPIYERDFGWLQRNIARQHKFSGAFDDRGVPIFRTWTAKNSDTIDITTAGKCEDRN